MDYVLSAVKDVDDSIIPDPEPATVAAFQAMMGKSFEAQPQVVNFLLDARPDFGRQFEKC